MAQAARRSQDQNLSVHFDGAPIKTNGSTIQNKGVRKALNDISNSGKPSAFQASRKLNLNNIIPIGEDLGASKKTLVSKSKNTKKPQPGSRKALGDLTNSVKPLFPQQQEKKIISIIEEENHSNLIAEERFLHNHDECIKSHQRALDMDMHQFLKTIGLHEDLSKKSSRKSKVDDGPMKLVDDGPMKLVEMDLPVIIEDKIEFLFSGESSPVCRSPKSPWLPSMNEDYDNFILVESP